MENIDNIKSLLWKVSGEGLRKPSYIFGTHHISSTEICQRIQGFEEAFASVSAVYSEVELSQIQSPDEDGYFFRSMRLPKAYILDELYSPVELERISSQLRSFLHTDIASMRHLKPSAIYSKLNLAQAMQSMDELGESSEERLDILLQERARQQGKELFGLETVRMQVDYLYNAPLEDQVQELLDYIALGNETGAYLDELNLLYLNQDIQGIYHLMMDTQRSGNSIHQLQRLVYSRNRRWTEILAPAFREKAVFVLIGAGHLPGPAGVLKLLEKKGLDLSPVF